MKQCETGGIREMFAQTGDTPYADGYQEAMVSWLVEQGFGRDPETR